MDAGQACQSCNYFTARENVDSASGVCCLQSEGILWLNQKFAGADIYSSKLLWLLWKGNFKTQCVEGDEWVQLSVVLKLTQSRVFAFLASGLTLIDVSLYEINDYLGWFWVMKASLTDCPSARFILLCFQGEVSKSCHFWLMTERWWGKKTSIYLFFFRLLFCFFDFFLSSFDRKAHESHWIQVDRQPASVHGAPVPPTQPHQ